MNDYLINEFNSENEGVPGSFARMVLVPATFFLCEGYFFDFMDIFLIFLIFFDRRI